MVGLVASSLSLQATLTFYHKSFLWLASLASLNWFGDSLDGTLAVIKDRTPDMAFVDHIIDTVKVC